eukprot:TRINITY_DN5622_c0_g1_i1.p1 TRINITY_DN5622_c0_g1~~TRINITY_DN5622_c0_g1_i1.p1  ORF type:complete len:183 (-),score=35.20 TRINITY_DN5622_c0_g1_i1:41-589(-)
MDIEMGIQRMEVMVKGIQLRNTLERWKNYSNGCSGFAFFCLFVLPPGPYLSQVTFYSIIMMLIISFVKLYYTSLLNGQMEIERSMGLLDQVTYDFIDQIPPPKNKGANDFEINKIKTRVLTEVDLKNDNPQEEGDCCSICLDELKVGDVMRILKCKHEIHADCIDRWLKIDKTCPMCKAVVV